MVAHRWTNSVAGWSTLPPVQTATSIPGGQPAVAIDDDGRIMITWREGDALVGRLKSRVMPPAAGLRHDSGCRCGADRPACPARRGLRCQPVRRDLGAGVQQRLRPALQVGQCLSNWD
ncbi:MAG: hypothetical protein MZW92_77465 [Comamonadaceae bacterium]|nr:hypothetical protein [Comamonadaceae bacterium]